MLAGVPGRSNGGRRTSGGQPPDKTCAGCGRTIVWRKAWERDWDEVRWCSAGCRRRGITATDQALEDTLRTLLAGAGRDGVDPDEAARRVAPEDPERQREPARRAARRLVAAGEAELVQQGRVVDPSTARGPVGLRRR